MTVMNMIQAVNDALKQEMRRDSRVLVMGEDVGKFGGVFRATVGLYEEFGPDRSIDTPLSEGGIIGTAIGMAVYGLRPVAEIQFADYIFPAFDQIVNELAKLRYRSGGQYPAPMVIRTPCGGGIRGGHYHSQSPEAYFIHTAGLKVVMPSNPVDAKGLLISAIRDDDPVIFFEPKRVYRGRPVEGKVLPWDTDVPEGDFTIPIGEAKVLTTGTHATLVTYGAMVHESLEAARILATEGVDIEVIDLRTLWPVDVTTIIDSVKKTGRFVVVHEAPRTCGFAAELITLVNERAFLHLEAPPARVTGWDVPFPHTLENDYMPLTPRILDVVRKTVTF
jgi:2-oxoisovalerate dehydrogenase E1 component beta subunit